MRCILNLPGPLGIGIIRLNRVVLAPDEKNVVVFFFFARACPPPSLFQNVFFISPFQDWAKNRSKMHVLYRMLLVNMRYMSSFPKTFRQN